MSLRLAALLSAPALLAGAAAEARVDGAGPDRVVSIALPQVGSATVAATVIDPLAQGQPPSVTVLDRPALPVGLAAALRLSRRGDGRYVLAAVLARRAAERGTRGAGRLRARIGRASAVRTDVAPEVEEWPRSPLPACQILDVADPRDPATVFFRSGGSGVTPGRLLGLGEDLVCDNPTGAGVLRQVGLPYGAWTMRIEGPDLAFAGGSFNVPTTTFFFRGLPPVVRVTCPSGFRCGPSLPRPDEPIVLYEGRLGAGARLASEIMFADSLDLVVPEATLSFVSGGEQLGPIDVPVLR